ncbi:MAG TPA: hypothetical protein VMK66_12590 [Myxococcales bacterium]|nr:hypothetical protein [Myxococcales bacterium]
MKPAGPLVWSMSNDDLLAAARALARKSSDLEAELLLHLGEIDERKLYLDWAFPSMYAFCVGELGFSEDAAYNRIHVARAGRRFPAILEAIREGRTHLWGMRLLIPHLTEENHLDLIGAASGKTKSGIEEMVAALAPRAPVATVIRSIPDRIAPAAASGAVAPMPAEDAASLKGPPLPSRFGPPVVPLSAQTYKIQFPASRAFRDRLLEAQDLMRHRIPDGSLEKILGAALELLIDQVKKERFAVGRKPRSTPPAAQPASSAGGEPAVEQSSERASRHIPDWIKRLVYERDGGRCTFVDDRGRRCGATAFLEFQHRKGFALTGTHDPEDICLYCHAHNQYAADKLYGRAFMDEARKNGSRHAEAPAEKGTGSDAVADQAPPEMVPGGAEVQSPEAAPKENRTGEPQTGESGWELIQISETIEEEPQVGDPGVGELGVDPLPGGDGTATRSGTSPPPGD